MDERDRTPSLMEEEGLPDLLEGTDGGLSRIEDEYAGTAPATRPASLDYGTTVEEQRHREGLDGRIAREVPDVTPALEEPEVYGGGAEPAGRLVEDDEGARTDTTKENVAHDMGADSGGFSAEEAAMHVENER